ncbi:hypothetical protein LP52_13735 [Streptomonospora alba]|uniref:Pectate lyase domain-containing protein n=1 Tax=Streptomonospora alba TaxID=183763 RepID=A0A0C2JH80_9ACTN|nr:hypothetical protein [Streptomonospora alba]KIH98245.1 hypothetical protein LP52_13735 [Streptomonospora alba]
MNRAAGLIATAAGAALVATALPAAAHPSDGPGPDRGHSGHGNHGRDLGREVLGPHDGWGAAEGGTTGGADAEAENVFRVDTWAGLQQAVQGDQPKIVYVEGDISAMTGADGAALSCEDFNDPAYTWQDYVDTYDPDTGWEGEASGPLEEARERSYDAHRSHVMLRPGSDTTIVGVGDASISDGFVLLESVENVIMRNLGVHDAFDCFPSWDGEAWDAQYDNIEVSRTEHVWLDHLTLSDGGTYDRDFPVVHGARVEHHDGLLDVVRASDMVTISWNSIDAHDKTMLFGNTDSERYDEWDKLRVTVHHNRFNNITQRAPRVRYGDVHVYNNLYTHSADSPYDYDYSLGAGVESHIYAQNNNFRLEGVEAGEVIQNWRGSVIHEEGSVFNGERVDLLDAYNTANPDNTLEPDTSWTPPLHGVVHPAKAVPGLVKAKAGAGNAR